MPWGYVLGRRWPRGTSRSDIPASEGPSKGGRIAATPGKAGLLNSPEKERVGPKPTPSTQEARKTPTNAAQRTGRPGGGKTLKLAML
ncbi:hypothetical protein NDU88_002049 [Pleurodeles waltl]|uniref:Uncharacterized protein n=1 Tax=Pleurodeles waltl TaxID=8319 RepID=A0AAV7T287_PLEWA|nr:hypothetical protein NDU88_002049 [Pleurodeles waltl]